MNWQAIGRILIVIAVSAFATAVNAAWNERSSTDRLTGVKMVRMESPALAPINQNGRAIVPKLTLSCVTPSDASPYLSAFIFFAEMVAVEDTKMRYRIDDGAVETRPAGVSHQGDYFQVVAAGQGFIEQLRNSSRLRIELPLLAGNAFMEFNTKGAEAAINKAQCK
jgi:hypothetical protein